MTDADPPSSEHRGIVPTVARSLAAILGLGLLLLAGYSIAGLLARLRVSGLAIVTVRDAAAAMGILALAFAGILLVAHFRPPVRIPLPRWEPRRSTVPTYGFGTVLAIGAGSTLGSPLFLLIPVNVMEYELVSIASLVLAAVLSVAMARIHARNYRILLNSGLAADGAPAFVRVAVGARSARYFVSRLSMAIANTTLAAYCMIVFVLFDWEFVPTLLAPYGIVGPPSLLVVVSIALLFAVWFVMNSILERRFIRTIGRIQILFTGLLLAILVGQSVLLGNSGNWAIGGLLTTGAPFGLGWVAALVINTGYLYLLFFGFQEIQSLEGEALPASRIPILSRLLRHGPVDKRTYIGYAMVASVVIASAVNILYGLAVYASHPDPSALTAAGIPALYLADTTLGRPQAILTAVAFLIAAFTTFVPAFMAASRHITSLGDDGFLPRGVGRASWALVLVAIVLLAIAGLEFLVSITDFMVLVSLGLIALTGAWLRRARRKRLEREDFLPIGVGLSCFIAAGALYAITPSVAVFGSISIAVAFLVYDVFELGAQGSRLFVAALCLTCYGLLALFPSRLDGVTPLPVSFLDPFIRSTAGLQAGLLLGAVGLILAFLLVAVLRQMERGGAPAPDAK